jgi:hypothetical protein
VPAICSFSVFGWLEALVEKSAIIEYMNANVTEVRALHLLMMAASTVVLPLHK